MNPNHATTIEELRRQAKNEVTSHVTSPSVVLRVIEELMAENEYLTYVASVWEYIGLYGYVSAEDLVNYGWVEIDEVKQWIDEGHAEYSLISLSFAIAEWMLTESGAERGESDV